MILVVGFDQRPGRDVGAGPVDHVAYRNLVVIPFLPVSPVLAGDLEALESDFFPFLEALELLFPADGEPELEERDAAPGELQFEVVDFRIGAHPVRIPA